MARSRLFFIFINTFYVKPVHAYPYVVIAFQSAWQLVKGIFYKAINSSKKARNSPIFCAKATKSNSKSNKTEY